MKAFRDLVESSIATGSMVGVDSLLADDVVFRSPVAYKPYPGKAITAAILNGCDFITTNDDGLIDEFTVMVRPMSGAKALMDAMAAQFPQIQADAQAYLEQQA